MSPFLTRCRAMAPCLLLAAAGAAPLAAQSRPVTQKLVIADKQTVHATITYELRTKAFAVSRWMVFVPQPPELAGQQVRSVATTPETKVVAERSGLARPVRSLDLPVAKPVPGAALAVAIEMEAVLRSRMLAPLRSGEKPPAVAPLEAFDRAAFTASRGTFDLDAKPFQHWLDDRRLRLGKDELPLAFAARVLEALRVQYRYRFDPAESKLASLVCGRAEADCGGLSYLMVAALRANRIPARALIGRLAEPRKEDAKPGDAGYDQPHVRAEAFVDGVGWVPIDPAFAVVQKNRPAADFIGRDGGDMLVLHVDPDLQLPFPDVERPAASLQLGPTYWTFGEGTFDGSFGPTGWDLRKVAATKK